MLVTENSKKRKIRSVKFVISFSFDDKYDNCADATDDEIIEEAERQFVNELEFGNLSFNDFDEELNTEIYYNYDESEE